MMGLEDDFGFYNTVSMVRSEIADGPNREAKRLLLGSLIANEGKTIDTFSSLHSVVEPQHCDQAKQTVTRAFEEMLSSFSCP